MTKSFVALLVLGASGMSLAQAPITGRKGLPAAPTGNFEFIPNKGQWDKHVKFLGRSPGVDMWVTDTGITYDYHRQDGAKTKLGPVPQEWNGQIVRVAFVGSGNKVKTFSQGLQKKAYTYNFFIGKDRSKWASHVPVYSAAKIQDLYQGVDLVAYYDPIKKAPRYDLVVKPGADASKIAMSYEGADGLHVTGKGLVAYRTSVGKVEERDLFAYQPDSAATLDQARPKIAARDRTQLNKVCPVAARMRLDEAGNIRFALGTRDRNKTTVIDPLIWSTYLGGNGESGIAMDVGSDGSVYVVGGTDYSDYPSTAGAYQRTFRSFVCYLSHLAPSGDELLSSTFYGGSRGSNAGSVSVLPDGSAVVGGVTVASDFPVTAGAWKTARDTANGNYGFITKFTPDGSALAFSTYVGSGPNPTDLAAVKTDAAGAVYAVGSTRSNSLATAGSAVPTNRATDYTAFALKLLPDGSAPVYCTYIGGASSSFARANDLDIDTNGNLYAVGNKSNFGFPTTAGAYITRNTNQQLGFVTKVAADGASFAYSTLLGGSDTDKVTSIRVGSDGSAYVSGMTTSSDFPVTSDAYQKTRTDSQVGFATRISADGSSLLWSTYFGVAPGKNGSILSTNIGIDSLGAPVLAGTCNGNPLPDTLGMVQPTNLSNAQGGYVVRFLANSGTVRAATYLSGSTATELWSVRVLPDDLVCVAGATTSIDYQTTGSSYQPLPPPTTWKHFVSKVDLVQSDTLTIQPATLTGGFAVTGSVVLKHATPIDLVVHPVSASPSLVKVPRSVTIPAGSIYVSFSIGTKPVDVTTAVDIRAELPGETFTRTLTLIPPRFARIRVSPDLSYKGKGDITLWIDGKAGPSGVRLTLEPRTYWDGYDGVISIPSSVTVPAGETSVTFTATSGDSLNGQYGNLLIHNPDGTVPWGETIAYFPPYPIHLKVDDRVLSSGDSTVGTFGLDRPAPPGGRHVSVASSDPTILAVSGPAFAPEGSKFATFTVTANPNYAGAPIGLSVFDTDYGITMANVQVRPLLVNSLAITPATLLTGYQATALITLSAPAPAGGLQVGLTSSNSTAFPVPATVTVPAGATVGQFTLQVTSTFAGPDTSVTVQTVGHGPSKSQTVKLKSLNLAAATVSPTSVKGGRTASLTVSLSAPTQSALTISLSSDSGNATVPSTLVIPAGAQSASVTVSTSAVAATISAHLTATLNGAGKTAALTITH